MTLAGPQQAGLQFVEQSCVWLPSFKLVLRKCVHAGVDVHESAFTCWDTTRPQLPPQTVDIFLLWLPSGFEKHPADLKNFSSKSSSSSLQKRRQYFSLSGKLIRTIKFLFLTAYRRQNVSVTWPPVYANWYQKQHDIMEIIHHQMTAGEQSTKVWPWPFHTSWTCNSTAV